MADDSVYKVLPRRIYQNIVKDKLDSTKVEEIKLRTDKPLIVLYDNREYLVKDSIGKVIIVTKEEMREMIGYISNYSLYAYEEEMKHGFITIEGGHRIGLCGQVIVESGKIKNFKYISSINVRIAHEVIGCADKVCSYLVNNDELYHTLIISPPRCGKTTLLRDLIRQISNGNKYVNGKTVGVVDERSEIGGCYKGIAQNNLGIRTDILDGCPKAEGMMMLIRSMGPEVIAVDEIGTVEDVHAVEYAMHSGCKMIATVHGKSLDEIKNKPILGKIVKEKRFERYIVLGNIREIGSVEGIYDESGRLLSDYRFDFNHGSRKSEAVEESDRANDVFTKDFMSCSK